MDEEESGLFGTSGGDKEEWAAEFTAVIEEVGFFRCESGPKFCDFFALEEPPPENREGFMCANDCIGDVGDGEAEDEIPSELTKTREVSYLASLAPSAEIKAEEFLVSGSSESSILEGSGEIESEEMSSSALPCE